MIRRPPNPPLFPYAPLFGSDRAGRDGRQDRRAGAGPDDDRPAPPRGRAGAVDRPVAGVAGREDRKSTRLNSSHANISYAVFCLQKKTPPRTLVSYSVLPSVN